MHNPDTGMMEIVTEESALAEKKKGDKGNTIFTIGELLPWKGVWFRVATIDHEGLYLKIKEK